MHPALGKPLSTAPVPSRSLLRFLHSQSQVAFSRPRYGSATITTSKPFCWSQPTGRRQPHTSAVAPARALVYRPSSSVTLAVRGCRREQLGRQALERYFGFSCLTRKASEPSPGSSQYASWQDRPAGKADDATHGECAEHGSFLNSRRVLSAKTSIDPRLRCTEVDENGIVTLVDGDFKKTELIAKYGLLPRDLRKIDSSNLPHILVRPSVILLNLLHLKVLIRHDRVLLFDIYGSKTSYPQSAFMYDLQGKLQQKSAPGSNGLPYEFRALEAVLTSVTSELEADFEAVREPVMQNLSELEDDIDRHKLRMLLILSKRVSTFEQKAKLVRDAIEELLEADDDLAAMYLTEKAHDLMRGLDDHTEVEMLLESYHKLTDEIVQEAQNLVSGIRNTEEIVRAILDANRNSLMLLDLKFSVGTLGLAMGTFIAGLYGMNLENFIEETNWGFGAVTGASMVFSLLVCWYGLIKLRKIQRVKMMSDERPQLPRWQHYGDEGALGGVLDSRNREMLRRAHMARAATMKKRGWSLFR